MRKYVLTALLLTAGLLSCACSKEEPQPETTSELVEEWMADASETEAVTLAAQEADEIDPNATSLDCFDYTIREDGTAAIIKFKGKDPHVVVTSHIGDAPVTEIEQYAFEASFLIETVELPESITKIGEFAFMDCSSMTSINIPGQLTALYRGTFAGCSSLTEVTIPAFVSESYEELFTGCALTDLYVLNNSLEYANWGLEEMDPKCTIHANNGAAILGWAEENGFPTAGIDE